VPYGLKLLRHHGVKGKTPAVGPGGRCMSLNTPVVVHCRAGVACTGVFILNKLMISCLEHNERVEVPIMLGHLMQQRMLMVQTISQYKFVYEVLIQFLKNSHLICTLTSDL
uniref:Tyrosine specific protein phosphatases domain-containing protein n=1 Tax=Oncorhynchus mykiss TaxID=8022 RepID=A0A8C7RQZ6_ONCMY